MPTILAIESSCDDTSAAIILDGKIRSNITATQAIHQKYGGIVPEVASRKHQINIVPVVKAALDEASIEKKQLDAIAVTRGPGLMGSLIVGVTFAKGLALSLGIPLIEVNHMQAHVLAHFAEPPYPEFPFLCLTVSGGHTQIVKVDGPLQMEVIGTTIDDAAGEAFDKSGKIMGLPYPAGPEIDKYAKKGKPTFEFSEPKIPGYDYSFSGLKTSILYFLKKQLKKDPDFITKNLPDLCASIQDAIIKILMKKLIKAAKELKINQIAIAGGVSANSGLRDTLTKVGLEYGWNTYIPPFEYCTDNAGMIAIAAHFKYENKQWADLDITPLPRMKM